MDNVENICEASDSELARLTNIIQKIRLPNGAAGDEQPVGPASSPSTAIVPWKPVADVSAGATDELDELAAALCYAPIIPNMFVCHCKHMLVGVMLIFSCRIRDRSARGVPIL